MSSNVSDSTLVNNAAPPINPSGAPEQQMTYEERCQQLKRIIRRKRGNIDAKRCAFDKLQNNIETAEKVTPVDSATIEKLTKELTELHAYINGMLGIHNFFVKKYQALIARKSENVKTELFNEMGPATVEAEGVDSDHAGGEDEDDHAT